MEMGVQPNQLAQHLADNDQLTLAMVEIVRDKAKSVLGDAAKVVDTEGNEVDLKAIYTEINGEEAVEEPADEPAAERRPTPDPTTRHRAPEPDGPGASRCSGTRLTCAVSEQSADRA